MAKISIDDAGGRDVRAIMHARLTVLPATATVREVRAYFAQSTSRRLAFMADEGRYVGSLTSAHVAGEDDPQRPAAEVAERGPTVSPDAPATTGRDLALQTESLRVPVVDDDGWLIGVVAITNDLRSFCGTSEG